jgi:hypothetical protein
MNMYRKQYALETLPMDETKSIEVLIFDNTVRLFNSVPFQEN